MKNYVYEKEMTRDFAEEVFENYCTQHFVMYRADGKPMTAKDVDALKLNSCRKSLVKRLDAFKIVIVETYNR